MTENDNEHVIGEDNESLHPKAIVDFQPNNILDTFSEKSTGIFESSATKLVNNNNENMNKFSIDLGQQSVSGINDRLTKNNTGVATISVNPNKNKNKTRTVTICVNPRNTSRANARNEDNNNISEFS